MNLLRAMPMHAAPRPPARSAREAALCRNGETGYTVGFAMHLESEPDGVRSPHLDPKQWDRLVEAIGLDSLLLVIERAMG